ncbi:TAXI family TRAP transporter solute-binding subunit [Paenalcaligenes sp. Me131]|uniref:TAXI family TRAP transporter solute-binding subunit n=1 Tax=Paenalcaligenes sp. Me131 TaxID=3392636 RepID=UPI003D2A5C9D
MSIRSYQRAFALLAFTAFTTTIQAEVVFSGVSATSDDYALGVVWSGIAKDAGLAMTVVENGTVAGMRKTAQEEVDFVAVGSPHYLDAVVGEGAYAKDPASIRDKYKTMKAVLGLPSGMAQYVVSADSSIKKISDFDGKKIGVGRPGGNAGKVSNDLFDLHTIKVSGQHLEYGPALEQLVTGALDGTLVWGSIPNASIDNASRGNKLRLVSLDEDSFTQLQEKISNGKFYILQSVPATTIDKIYEGRVLVEGDHVNFWTFPWQVMVNESVDEEVVYQLTKALWENIEKVQASSAALSLIQRDTTLKGISADLHPGAEKYYREVGMLN